MIVVFISAPTVDSLMRQRGWRGGWNACGSCGAAFTEHPLLRWELCKVTSCQGGTGLQKWYLPTRDVGPCNVLNFARIFSDFPVRDPVSRVEGDGLFPEPPYTCILTEVRTLGFTTHRCRLKLEHFNACRLPTR